MDGNFTPLHRGGVGTPMVCLHGFTDTWRGWELVLPSLEDQHDVLAPTLTGHMGGPPLEGRSPTRCWSRASSGRWTRRAFETAHIVGNSLGGYVALQLAARGRAESVVALAPAGGWAEGDESLQGHTRVLRHDAGADRRPPRPHAEALLSTPEGRRMATAFTVTNYEHIPAELLAAPVPRCGRLRCRRPADRIRARERLDPGRRADRVPGQGRLGHRRTGSPVAALGRRLPRRPAARTPIGSSSRGSATARSSTFRSRPRS